MIKFLPYLFGITFLFSCSKNPVEPVEKPVLQSGTIIGTIKAYDKYGIETVTNNDVTIKLIDKENAVSIGSPTSSGTFHFENVLLGTVTLAIRKPGYGFVDTVSFEHLKALDTISNIHLIEELPFSFKLNSAGYSNSSFRFSGIYAYPSTDNYMVTEFFCFSKDPGVSVTHTSLVWSPGSQTNVQFIMGTSGGSSSLSFKTLTGAGFKSGDEVYVTLIPSIGRFWTSYYDPNNNYKILHYKVGNASNVVSFTLSQ